VQLKVASKAAIFDSSVWHSLTGAVIAKFSHYWYYLALSNSYLVCQADWWCFAHPL
jgi:hypothetical protein